jgi:thiol:disulfide interchange protein DsbG
MRWLIGLAALTAMPALAGASECIVPDPVKIAAADIPTAAAQSDPQPTSAAGAASPTPIAPKPTIPRGLSGMSFAQHVSGAGATILDLGTSHGLHLMAARNGGEFRVFSVLPNGLAAVEGAPVDLTVQQLTAIAAGSVTQLGDRDGFEGLFVRSGAQFQVFYAAPDSQVVIPGILRNAQGKNLMREQVANIPGAMPTVEVSGHAGPDILGPAAADTTDPTIATAATLAAVEKADYGSIGPTSAPQLFMLIDPQCIYSVRSFQQLRGFAQAGKIRLSIVPLSILDYEDRGQSTRSALALLSKPTDQIVSAWESGDVGGPVSPQAADYLKQNMTIASALGVKGTPTFIWRKADGSAGRIDGVPMDVGALISSIGS